MKFDYDPDKSAANRIKHGIDFNAVWSGVITHRGDAIRIISARRSRLEEVALYEDQSI